MNLGARRASTRQHDLANEGSAIQASALTGLSGKAKNYPASTSTTRKDRGCSKRFARSPNITSRDRARAA